MEELEVRAQTRTEGYFIGFLLFLCGPRSARAVEAVLERQCQMTHFTLGADGAAPSRRYSAKQVYFSSQRMRTKPKNV